MEITKKHFLLAFAVGITSAVLVAAGGHLPPWAEKKIPFTPSQGNGNQDSYWIGVGGENPDTPGCHMEFVPNMDRSNLCAEWINGRQFGEKCDSPTMLIETNPADGVCHTHGGDVGGPYLVDCDKWCKGKNAANAGTCIAEDANCGGDRGTVPSARCDCKLAPTPSPSPKVETDSTPSPTVSPTHDDSSSGTTGSVMPTPSP